MSSHWNETYINFARNSCANSAKPNAGRKIQTRTGKVRFGLTLLMRGPSFVGQDHSGIKTDEHLSRENFS